MKRNSLILCLFLIVSFYGVASAQIVFGPDTPAAIGIVNTGNSTGAWSGGYPYVGDSYGVYKIQGVIEFYLDPASVPTVNMTANNFTARLDGMSVNNSYAYISSMNVMLYDMLDVSEDGVVKLNDLRSKQGGAISSPLHVFSDPDPANHANFDNVDVTAEVRNDLFGAGAGEDFTGFIFIANPDTGGFVVYNDDPTLTITRTTGGGGDVDDGGGCFIATAAR
jgi:hypothetical protein